MISENTPIPVSVLIVDDNPAKLTALAAALEGMDVDVVSATSGTEALHQLLEHDFAVVLLDVNMPIMDGFETAGTIRLRQKSEYLPILFITAERLTDDARLKGYALGAVDYIFSPVLPQILRSKVAVFAELYRLRKQIACQNTILAKQVGERTASLQSSEEKLRKITESAQDAIIMMGADGRISFWNAAAGRIFGYTAEEALGKVLHDLITPPQSHAASANGLQHFRESGDGPVIGNLIEVTALRKGGVEFLAELSVAATQLAGEWHAIGIVRDITARRQAETDIRHANRALFALSAVNRSLVRITDANELLQTICLAIVQKGGYRLAWVGYVQHDENKTIKLMAHAGHNDGFLEAMRLSWADTARGTDPCGRAIRSGLTQCSQDIAKDQQYLPWHDEALKRGYAANIAFPLLNADGTVFGILSVYSDEVNAFSSGEVKLLEEMAGDMAFGVNTLHLRHELDLSLLKNKEQLVRLVFQNEEKGKRAAELVTANKKLVFQNEEKEKRAAELVIANQKLQDSLDDTVQAIATIGEMRDPYTAGHQVRVAGLAAAIAKHLELHDEQVHSIHLAGTLHDLGKIKVPSDILSRPGKIDDDEFTLIKRHAQSGYDILKDIKFPWPIAQMVLQHHERLDGSGYPQGLKGDEILFEARILSVADVVEAMASHRPYRPGLGVDAALAEITKQRGTHFDPKVVDACLAVFHEQHYAFKS